jgi:hypothetical protein
MFREFKSAKELADLVMTEARKIEKCAKLTGVRIKSSALTGDWTIHTRYWKGSGSSLESCVNELREIEKRLKEQGFGIKK